MSFIASIASCGLIGCYILISGQSGPVVERVLASVASVGGASILSLAAAAAWEAGRWRWVSAPAMMLPAVALLLLLGNIWDVLPSNNVYWGLREEACATASAFAIAAAHTSLLSLARLHRGYEWVRIVTVAALWALALFFMIPIWGHQMADSLARQMGVLAILAVCGTIAVPVLHRVSGIRLHEQVVTTELQLSLTCPRCNLTQKLPVGRSRCTCGLRFNIDIVEEHCPKCGYSLYKAGGGRCPECGTLITDPVVHAAG